MKTLTIIGTLIVLVGASLNSTEGIDASWMVVSGFVLLFGALTLFGKRKGWKIVEAPGFVLMVLPFLFGFTGVWYQHPLGGIISTTGVGWVLYRMSRVKKHEVENIQPTLLQKFSQKLQPGLRKHIKLVVVPLGILSALWLSKSLLIAFVVGFAIVVFLDKQSIKERGLNRTAVLLILYIAGFCLLIIGTFKTTSQYGGIFYDTGDVFFNNDTHVLLRDMTRGL